MLMMEGGLAPLIRFCTAIKPPKVVFVFAQEASSIAAFGAAALAYSASKSASTSSPLTPGLVQFPGCTWENEPAVKGERPNAERKVFQSVLPLTLVSSITTTVWPWPEIPEVKSGVKL